MQHGKESIPALTGPAVQLRRHAGGAGTTTGDEPPGAADERCAQGEGGRPPWRPVYHYVNPENTLNDPNGLCYWQGRWHLFYQACPPEDTRQHWAHAVSEDLIHWRDLPYALCPGPEDRCYSGTTLVEKDRVIALYHGVELGNMIAISRDPLLLNWEKLAGNPVIPFGAEGEAQLPHAVFDPCIWSSDGAYYALAGGIIPCRPGGKHVAAEYLFRSQNLEDWEYLHPFIEGDRFTVLGDDGACPYFWPIGDRHILLFFSHMSGGQYWLGDHDQIREKFVVDAHGLFNSAPRSRVASTRPRPHRRERRRHRSVQHEPGQTHVPDERLPEQILRRP